MNNFFADAIMKLEYSPPYLNHSSIKLIKTNSEHVSFRFQKIQAIEIEKELKNLDCSKASQDSNISTKIIKDNIDICASSTNRIQ